MSAPAGPKFNGTMKAIVFDRIGSPLDVLRLRDVPAPSAGPGQVLVQVRSASINPGDFLFIQSLYPDPKKPRLPQIAGQHGAGTIVAAGDGVSLAPGSLVAFSYQNVWAEHTVVPVEWLIPLPAEYPLEKAGQFMNLITAWDLLEEAKVAPGQWLALTAGNSTVATMVAQMARRRGIHVVSIVRRTQPEVDLKDFGASAVIDLSEQRDPIGEQLAELTRGQGLSAIIDPVGGPLVGDLVRALAWAGRLVIYGGYGNDRFALHNFDILMKDVRIGAYVYRYFFDPPKKSDSTVLEAITELAQSPDFRVRVGGTHPLEDFERAVRESWERPEQGKRFFVAEGGYR
ncbi:zinc-binding alcohol dehydrogenase family protein [Pendulispora albinea]|uniref:Zinc-binding dehydrogenase n=1 Tax=Pendulispora albinea TaxID=2741071 RepID=A0ABZ2LQ08_9BACT